MRSPQSPGCAHRKHRRSHCRFFTGWAIESVSPYVSVMSSVAELLLELLSLTPDGAVTVAAFDSVPLAEALIVPLTT